MYNDACSSILEDAGFKNDTKGSVTCLKMAHDFLSRGQSKPGHNKTGIMALYTHMSNNQQSLQQAK
jgi:hypothetical protein